MARSLFRLTVCLTLIFGIFGAAAVHAGTRQITDSAGRPLTIPENIKHIICSGPGCLRLITYLGAQDLVVGVDDMEKRRWDFDARPYFLANPQFRDLPVFGEFRGRDNPEKIISLSPLPQVIFKTYSGSGTDPVKLQKKTGIPVIILEYGDLGKSIGQYFHTLTLLGKVLDRRERAEQVISFFKEEIRQLKDRTRDPAGGKTCFVGGIAFRGPHGFQSTEPGYPPFLFVGAQNIACPGDTGPALRHSIFSKEKLLVADPEVLFLDLSTLQMGRDQGGLFELRTDPVYREMTAVKKGQVFGLLPYNWYTQNHGSVLANAWYIGKVLYPEQFADIDPETKADEIYEFLVSKPVFGQLNASFQNMAFQPVELN
ncbi:iron ABC transporter substrate-binding protein [Desulfospira joergensenii]|uniref:iron ABC transporter substrate-binding protein n=1 Tax=Desulfospira joergensenii TaxID=53329 RepID=UPI000489C159|nr:iron ABC transporter substrate-binding protein [Desulfospira joergensenii]